MILPSLFENTVRTLCYRKSVSDIGQRGKAYENFYKALKQLHRLRERYFFLKNDSKNLLKLKLQVEKLLAKLQNRDDIVSSVWLIEQTEILLRKF